MRKLAFSAIALLSLAACGDPAKIIPVQPISAPPALVEKAHAYLVYDFIDARSAEFRNERAYRLDTGDYAICGEVNGHNRFGGYTGYQNYYVRMTAEGAGVRKYTGDMGMIGCAQLANGQVNTN